jgi:hypothetical protein
MKQQFLETPEAITRQLEDDSSIVRVLSFKDVPRLPISETTGKGIWIPRYISPCCYGSINLSIPKLEDGY